MFRGSHEASSMQAALMRQAAPNSDLVANRQGPEGVQQSSLLSQGRVGDY